MIISRYAYVKIAPSNVKYWGQLGYDVGRTGGKNGMFTGSRLKVKVHELKAGSNVSVSCKCESCGEKYVQRLCRDTSVCYKCRKTVQMRGNKYGTANKGRPSILVGEKHPRWNPNKTEFKKYANRVRWLTIKEYQAYKDWINPTDRPLGVCGVEGAYQIDHKLSIKRAFEMNLPAEAVARFHNLQVISWEGNRSKGIS